ncbi:unnamed protein product [Lactuca virosa]|uniref:t-SNARE coiled-coil homology domain-containing protein n=1 Tax=Lactuca virosa TaxID=75947 RepID=A0AAU9MA68_9ASTR|nr:unnamed protein product [Lactuca virosa]
MVTVQCEGADSVNLMKYKIKSVIRGAKHRPTPVLPPLPHIPTNEYIAGEPQDIQITILQLQLEVSLIREEFKADQRHIRESLLQEMDYLNHEVDDIRVGLLEVSNLTDDLRNHFYSLQPAYVMASTDIAKLKKVLVVTSLFGVVIVAGVVAAYKWF